MSAEHKIYTVPPQLAFVPPRSENHPTHLTFAYDPNFEFSENGTLADEQVEVRRQQFLPVKILKTYDPDRPDAPLTYRVLEDRWRKIWEIELPKDKPLDEKIRQEEQKMGRRILERPNHYTVRYEVQKLDYDVPVRSYSIDIRAIQALSAEGFIEHAAVEIGAINLKAGGQFGGAGKGNFYRTNFFGRDIIFKNTVAGKITDISSLQTSQTRLLVAPFTCGKDFVYLFSGPINLIITPNLDQIEGLHHSYTNYSLVREDI